MRLRSIIGVTGELLVTAGILVLLFVGWLVGWRGAVDSRAQAAAVADIELAIAGPGASVPGTGSASAPGPGSAPSPDIVLAPPSGPLTDGQVLGVLRIPRLGADWAKPIYEGVGAPILAKGIGHYPGTARAGEIGNLGLAGHRAGSGNPLLHIDDLVPGDAIVVETREGWSVYRVVRHTIVPPTGVQVLAPVPERPGATPTEAWLTLTSCDPPFTAKARYVVFARLEQTRLRAEGAPVAALAAPGGR